MASVAVSSRMRGLGRIEATPAGDTAQFADERHPELEEGLDRGLDRQPHLPGDPAARPGRVRGDRECDRAVSGSGRVEIGEEGARDALAVIAERRSILVVDGIDPWGPLGGLMQLTAVDPGHPLGGLAHLLEARALRTVARKHGDDDRSRESAMATRCRERLDLAGVAPATKRRRRYADHRGGLVHAHPLLAVQVSCSLFGHARNAHF